MPSANEDIELRRAFYQVNAVKMDPGDKNSYRINGARHPINTLTDVFASRGEPYFADEAAQHYFIKSLAVLTGIPLGAGLAISAGYPDGGIYAAICGVGLVLDGLAWWIATPNFPKIAKEYDQHLANDLSLTFPDLNNP